jgi:branched-chain amino acid transport system substrate-binding protein
MKSSKLYLVVCMVVLLAGLIAGCTTPQTTTQAPAKGNNEQPAATKPAEIVIGVYEPMTGAQAAGGAQTYQGIQLAAEQTKEVLGVPIKVVLVDNRSDKTESATAMTRLIQQEKAIVVIGSYGSSNSMAGGEVSEKAGIPVIGDSPTNPLVTQGKKFYFRVCFIDPFQGRVMAKYAKENGIQKVAIIKNISQDYSVGLSAFFRASWKELYGNEDGIVAETSYQDGDQDFTAQLGAIKDADAIYAPGYYGDAALLMKQAREMGFKGLFMGSDAWEAPELGKIAGAAAEGAVISSHYSADAVSSPVSQAFVDAFKTKYNETANTFAALGYDAFNLALDAIKRANSFDPKAIRDAIASTKDYPGVTGSITINATGDAVKDAVILQVKNGVFAYLTTVKP